MKLRTFTNRPLLCVEPSDSFDRAICLMEEHTVHHLPVVQDGRIVGMVSDRDILLAVGWRLEIERLAEGERIDMVGPRQIEDVMSRPPVCLSPDDSLDDAARLMAERRIHAIVVARNHQPVGIVTSFDVLQQHSTCGGPATNPRLLEPARLHMRTSVFMVGPRESLITAGRIMREKGIHHLPVSAGDSLVGLVSDRDLRRATGEEMVEDARAEASGEFYIGPTMVMEVMSRHVETAKEENTLQECLDRMVVRRIGCIPIVRDDRVVGILTDTDMMRILAQMEQQSRLNSN